MLVASGNKSSSLAEHKQRGVALCRVYQSTANEGALMICANDMRKVYYTIANITRKVALFLREHSSSESYSN